MKQDRWRVFSSSVFFVLGFASVFSLLGVLLQTVLSGVSYQVQTWLSRLGGVLIILFGLNVAGLWKPSFLMSEKRLSVKKFKSKYLTSFLFGSAFAAGWTPCVGAVLGAVLTLAATNPGSAFIFLFSYSLGLGLPFMVFGFFAERSRSWIKKAGPWLESINKFFGYLLIIIGVFVFTNQLSRLANVEFLTNLLMGVNSVNLGAGSGLGIGLSFLAGLVSFLSPCVLPLIPGFLTFISSDVVDEK